MTPDDDLTPHLGRIRDLGRSGGRRFARQVKRAAKQLGKPRSSKTYTGRQYGVGNAKARQLGFRTRHLSQFRLRRVVVKVHIARSSRGGGTGAFRAHVNYIQRDGVDRDGLGGDLYTKEDREIDTSCFLEQSSEDRHQFRIIISPEDGTKLGDLRGFTREIMSQAETDLGTRLDWVAVDHYNTGHPHTHVVIRGKDQRGKDLVIAPEYLKSGFRHRASDIATETLGPRRDVEIARAKHAQINKDRFTQIDRDLLREAKFENSVKFMHRGQGKGERFRSDLKRQRLRHLRGLGLAREIKPGHWQLSDGWDQTLKTLGKRGDIIRTLAEKYGHEHAGERLATYMPDRYGEERLIGSVLMSVPDDELKSTRSLILEDFQGKRWLVPIGRGENGYLPPDHAIVELRPRAAAPGIADQTISVIAQQSGGQYSESVHREHDPSGSSNFIKAHIRRLEALRRAGIVERFSNGTWSVPRDYLDKVERYERHRSGAQQVIVRSWISLEKQISYEGVTWLDESESHPADARIKEALKQRRDWLRENGYLEPGSTQLSDAARSKLVAQDLARAEARIKARSNRDAKHLSTGDVLEGRYEGSVNLGHRRLAIIGNTKEFALVPWRRSIERSRGKDMVLQRGTSGVSWTIGRTKDLGFSR